MTDECYVTIFPSATLPDHSVVALMRYNHSEDDYITDRAKRVKNAEAKELARTWAESNKCEVR